MMHIAEPSYDSCIDLLECEKVEWWRFKNKFEGQLARLKSYGDLDYMPIVGRVVKVRMPESYFYGAHLLREFFRGTKTAQGLFDEIGAAEDMTRFYQRTFSIVRHNCYVDIALLNGTIQDRVKIRNLQLITPDEVMALTLKALMTVGELPIKSDV